MTRTLLTLMLTVLLAGRPLTAQHEVDLPRSDSLERVRAVSIGPLTEPSRLLQARSVAPVSRSAPSPTERLHLQAAPRHDRLTHAVVGGLIGSAAGIVACTAISNLAKDAGSGFTTCTSSGYLGFMVGGFAVGALIGALIK